MRKSSTVMSGSMMRLTRSAGGCCGASGSKMLGRRSLISAGGPRTGRALVIELNRKWASSGVMPLRPSSSACSEALANMSIPCELGAGVAGSGRRAAPFCAPDRLE